MAVKLQCEICGGKLIGKPGGIFECDSCGMEYSTAWAKEKIQEITGTVKVEGTVEVTGKVQVEGGTVQVDNSANKDSFLRRGELALEDSDWAKAKEFFDQALNIDAECAEAYLGLVMAETESRDRKAFRKRYNEPNSAIRLKRNSSLSRARQFSKELDEWFSTLDEEGTAADHENILHLSMLREKIARPMNMIAASREHTVGLYVNGNVVSTKYLSNQRYYHGQCEVGNWRDIVAVAVGDGYTVGLHANGTVIATKYTGDQDDYFGQCEVGGWTDIIAVSASSGHTVGLKADGTVVAVGNNHHGQCDVRSWREIVAVAAGDEHTVGLRTDGTVVTVGSNHHGQCDVDAWREVVAVAAAAFHTIGLQADGTVLAAGYNRSGGCEVSSWRNIVAIDTGDLHTVGLQVDGTVVATKYVGNEFFNFYNGGSEVSSWEGIVGISVGYHTVGLRTDGTVIATNYIGDQWSSYCGQCEVSGWKLFDNYETIEAEREAAAEKAEAERKAAAERAEAERKAAKERAEAERKAAAERAAAAKKARIEALSNEETTLHTELANLRGLFTGKRRREIEERLDEIDAELKKLQ